MAGRHITFDASVRDSRVFTHGNLSVLFDGLCERLGMIIIFGPVFKDVDIDLVKLMEVQAGGDFQDDGGTTGIVVISTSHISIHTWALRKFFQMDVFSCKDFDTETTLQYIYEMLDVDHASVCEIVRHNEHTRPDVISTYSQSMGRA